MTEEKPLYELVFTDETGKVVFAITSVTRIFSINGAGIRFEKLGHKQSQYTSFKPNEKLEVRRINV